MIVVDSSAIVAVFGREPETAKFLDRIEESRALTSAATVLEVSIVIRARKLMQPELAERWLNDFLRDLAIATEAVLIEDVGLAREAHMRFGKGTGHPAQLNFGDCFSYALAKRLKAPLLFKGSDFAQTDIASAL